LAPLPVLAKVLGHTVACSAPRMPTLTLKFQLGKSPIWEAALGKIQHLGKGPHKDRIWSMTDLVNQDKVAPD